MADKTTHFGRAGEFFAMSELLLRGWNVAVPVVDIGDDVFVIDDNDKTTYRVQVKSAQPSRQDRWSFSISRTQLRDARKIELFYMLLMRSAATWQFLVIPREELFRIRTDFENSERKGPGAPPKKAEDAKTDQLSFVVDFDTGRVTGWGASLNPFLGAWPSELPVIRECPHILGRTRARARARTRSGQPGAGLADSWA